jgi:nitrogen fixation NifU-like protein
MSNELYQQIVLRHHRQPRRFQPLASPTHAADGANPMCGDHLHVQLHVEGGRIVALGFSGESCAITTATASMLGDLVEGRTVDALPELQQRFETLLCGGIESDPALNELNALAELKRYPARRQCALLPWAALRAALDCIEQTTTERDVR